MRTKPTLLITIFLLIYSINSQAQECKNNPPDSLSVTNITSCSVTLNWQSPVSATYYVAYKLTTAAAWSANLNVGNALSYTFTGLQAGQQYNFRVFSKCSDGSRSARKKILCNTVNCQLPDSFTVSVVNGNSASINAFSGCSFDSLHVRYKTLTSSYSYADFSGAGPFLIPGLQYDSTYFFSVSTCPLANNNWTNDTLITLPKLPNIIFIIVDDARYDLFSCNGAPSWFHTPNIDRIANEGVNFKNTFCVTSLCAPSRACMATGLHSLHTKVYDNGSHLDPSYITVPEVLGTHGYYTTLVGKNHGTFLYDQANPEFDYWLWAMGNEDEANNIKKYNYNGVIKVIDKDFMLTITDTALALINRVNDPLFMWLAYKVPHLPANPLPWDKHLYDSLPIPYAADTAKYLVNYPSFTYANPNNDAHGIALDTSIRATYEVLAGLDSCIGVLINALEQKGELDNTLLIFIDDNGFMFGNHWMLGKTYAYEPSMRIPLFVRYPAWFPAGSIATAPLALNIDMAPTMYQAAGISSGLPQMDGVSVKDQFDGTFQRKSFYYFMLHDSSSRLPTVRCIRDANFKYIHHNCVCDTVEELFDMVNDPLELTNLVNDTAYASTLAMYEAKLDSFKAVMPDTLDAALQNCYIENPSVFREELEDDVLPEEPVLHPTLTAGTSVELFIPWSSADVTLFDDEGRAIMQWKVNEQFNQLTLPQLPQGIYFVNIRSGGNSSTKKLVITGR